MTIKGKYSNDYPLIFRGKKTIKNVIYVNISNIKIDKLPINPDGLSTAMAIYDKKPMPPIKIQEIKDYKYKYRILNGRHRLLGFKINGYLTIPAYVSKLKEL